MSIKIPIVSDFDGKGIKKAIAEFKQLETTSQKAQFAIQKAAVPAVAALAGLGTAAFKAAQRASDLAEEQSKVGVIFGESAKEVLDFSKNAGTALGQSQRQALAAAGTFGTLGKAAGLTGSELAGFTTQFTTLASDLASFNNTTPEDAIQAIGAALRGEAEPIRRYGVLLDDATLRNKAFQLGLIKTTKDALTPANKSLAAQAFILEQTRDAQGDFARTSDGAANQQRIMAANIENATAAIGNAFLPILEKTLPVLADMAEFVEKNSDLVIAATVAFGGFATAIVAARVAMIAYRTIAIATTAVNAALAASGFAVQISTGIGIASAIAGMAALGGITYALTKMLNTQKDGYEGANKAAIENREINNLIAKQTMPDLSKSQGDATAATAKATARIAEQNAKLKQLRSTIKGDFKNAMESAQGILKKAQDNFTSFGKSVSDAITGTFSFGNAQNTASDNAKKLNDALSRQTKAQEKVNRLQSEGASDQLTEAMAELRDVTNEVVEAQSKPMTFFDTLTQQANKTKDFGVQVNRLLAAGLSEDALQQVLAAGLDAGSLIADELLNGGADAISKANTLTAEIQTLGDTVGTNAAVQFRQAGVDAGTALVEGINQAIANFQLKLTSKKLSARQLARLQKNFGVEVDFLMSSGQIPAMANGGIVTGPTLALIGEAGPEAVIPLDRAGGMGGNNVTINVNGGDPQAVVDALRRYMQLNGSVPIRVS